ncbi:MAG TPA: GNAT family N-acetyltransferase [Rhizobium sp.]|nr:GNAT family N-acetyltransferase [Rhizobium sp.]
MVNPVEVRALGKPDLQGLLALYGQLIENDLPLTPDLAAVRFDEILARDGLTVFGAFVDSTLASTCTLIVVPNLTRGGMPYAFIENVVTDAGHRRSGLGRRTIQAAVETAFQAGCYTVRLMTGAKRPGTLDFYRSCGFDTTKHGLEIRRIPPR